MKYANFPRRARDLRVGLHHGAYHVVVRAKIECANFVSHVVACRQHDDRNVARLTDRFEYGEPVAAGHADVEQHQIGLSLPEQVKCRRAGIGQGHLKALKPQAALEQAN
jgi:hypothetical protein